jgi:hypothetical protein
VRGTDHDTHYTVFSILQLPHPSPKYRLRSTKEIKTWINFLRASKHNFPAEGSDALKLLQEMLHKLCRAISFCTHRRLRSGPHYLHIWGVHAPTDWHHVLLCALNDLKQNRHRDNWIPVSKRASVETLHEYTADDLAHCLGHAFFVQETSFVGVFVEQLRVVTIGFVVSFSTSVFPHETTSTERICRKINIEGFYKNVSILSKFSESRIR